MSALRFLTGDPAYYNLMRFGPLTSSSANALFPLANLGDGDPGKMFRFGTAAGDQWLQVDADMLPTGKFDSWSGGAPVGWTKTTTGTGAVTQDSVVRDGASGSSAKLNNGASGTAKISALKTVRAGAKVMFDVRIRNDAATNPSAKLYIQNKTTGLWLKPHPSGGSNPDIWQSLKVEWCSIVGTAGGFAYFGGGIASAGAGSGLFQIEDFLACGGRDTVQLEFTCESVGGAGDVWFDTLNLYPGYDFVSVHGHNAEGIWTTGGPLLVRARRSFDGAAFVTDATLTPLLPSFYTILPETVYGRFFRLDYLGTPNAPVWFGEVVFGQLETALRSNNYGWSTKYIFDQLRFATQGHVQTFKHAQLERRALQLAFQLGALAEFQQMRDQWARRSFGGHYPMVVVPDDSDASMVIHGRVSEEWDVVKHFLATWESDIIVEESGFPSVTA